MEAIIKFNKLKKILKNLKKSVDKGVEREYNEKAVRKRGAKVGGKNFEKS